MNKKYKEGEISREEFSGFMEILGELKVSVCESKHSL
jgi:hypothetical protein